MKQLRAVMALTTHDLQVQHRDAQTATHFSMQDSYPSFYVFVLQKTLLCLNGINLKGAAVTGQIFHEKPQLSSSLKAFLVNK